MQNRLSNMQVSSLSATATDQQRAGGAVVGARPFLTGRPVRALVAAGALALLWAGATPWARFGPGPHSMIGVCGGDGLCKDGTPGPPHPFMLIASLLVLFLALRGLRSSETFGVQVGAIATVGILLGLDTWSIQTAYHALGMEIREAGFYLAPAGAALLAAGALLIYVGRRKWFLAGMLTVLVLTGAYAEVNLVR